jgi:hypothetical protein
MRVSYVLFKLFQGFALSHDFRVFKQFANPELVAIPFTESLSGNMPQESFLP